MVTFDIEVTGMTLFTYHYIWSAPSYMVTLYIEVTGMTSVTYHLHLVSSLLYGYF